MILDTNALSALADEVPAAIKAASADAAEVPVIVLGEFRFGIGDSRRRADYEAYLDAVGPLLTILEITAETAVAYADVRRELRTAGTPIPVNDLWIAALARQHRLAILSRDTHFDRVRGLRRVGW